MIDVTNVTVYGFEAAIRGMRNPMIDLLQEDAGELFR